MEISLSRDHGTVGFFKSFLNRHTVQKEPKKSVDATFDFFRTVVVGHFMAKACEQLNISSFDEEVTLPEDVRKGSNEKKRLYVKKLRRGLLMGVLPSKKLSCANA